MDQSEGEHDIHRRALNNGIGKPSRLWNSDCLNRAKAIQFEGKLEAYTYSNRRWSWMGKHGSSVSSQ